MDGPLNWKKIRTWLLTLCVPCNSLNNSCFSEKLNTLWFYWILWLDHFFVFKTISIHNHSHEKDDVQICLSKGSTVEPAPLAEQKASGAHRRVRKITFLQNNPSARCLALRQWALSAGCGGAHYLTKASRRLRWCTPRWKACPAANKSAYFACRRIMCQRNSQLSREILRANSRRLSCYCAPTRYHRRRKEKNARQRERARGSGPQRKKKQIQPGETMACAVSQVMDWSHLSPNAYWLIWTPKSSLKMF